MACHKVVTMLGDSQGCVGSPAPDLPDRTPGLRQELRVEHVWATPAGSGHTRGPHTRLLRAPRAPRAPPGPLPSTGVTALTQPC